MSVCRVSPQKEAAVQAVDASAADTIPAQQSAPQTAHEDAEEMRVWLIAERVPEDDYVRAASRWHSVDVDGRAQQQAHQSIQRGLIKHNIHVSVQHYYYYY